MLRYESFVTALPYASTLAAKGFGLAAVPGTILGELSRLSAPAWDPLRPAPGTDTTSINKQANLPLESEEDIQVWASYIASTTNGSQDNPSLHTTHMNELIEQLSALVVSHVAYAKNVVKPGVIELADAIVNYTETNKPSSAVDKFNIKPHFIPAVLKDDSFLDTLSSYKNTPALKPEETFSFAPKSPEELTALVMTGSARTDKLITEWLLTKDAMFLKNIWDTYFARMEGTSVFNDYLENGLNAFERCETALGHYLISRKIQDDVQESSLPLSQYKIIAAQYRDYSGSILVSCLNKIGTLLKNNVLVVYNNSFAKTLEVNGELYSKWLEEGGSVEVLLGLMISGESVTSRTLIDEKAETYKRNWNQFETLHKLSEQNNASTYYKHFVLNKFIDLYKEMDPVESDFVLKNTAYVDGAIAKAREYLDSMNPKEIMAINPHELALTLVAKFRFAFTSSYQILSDINRAGQVNPNADVREAALLATINYITDFLFDQMVVVK